MNFILVFLGGGLGSLVRYGLNLALADWHQKFPVATLLANALACFVLGFIFGLGAQLTGNKRLLWATGFCGGFSTFSTFTGETLQLFEAGSLAGAVLNVVLNLFICLFFLIMGMKLAS